MREQEEEVAECDPCPTLLNEELVEDVALFCEIRGCGTGEVGLCRCVVGSCSCGGIKECEEGSGYQSNWVDSQ